MKIRTAVNSNPDDFDKFVNEYLEKGYLLEHRGLLPNDGNSTAYHYAQLVLPDPPAPDPSPGVIDPIQALYIVKSACLAHQGPCNDCPMTEWCERLAYGGDPTDWELPEVEA